MHWTEVRDLFRKWREENVRNSREVVNLWETILKQNVHKLGDEEYLVCEQVCLAALDCNRRDVAYVCAMDLVNAFPNSLRVRKLQALELDAEENYEDAFDVLDSIIKHDDTNAAPRKRLVAILKSCQRIPEAIKELNDYLKKFMSDQEAWQELSELYLLEQDYGRAAFCMEELIMHSPHNHLVHQRYAEIRYTQGGLENYELARAHYCLCLKLNPHNIRALYGLLLSAVNIASNPKTSATKKKESNKLAIWAGQQVKERYEEVNKTKEDTAALEGLVAALQLSVAPPAITQ